MEIGKKKIQGFTINELLIVMVVSSVVVGLAYTAINLLSKNVYTIQENYSESDAILLLEQRLTIDFNSYPTSHYSETENRLKFSSPLDSITYAFEENYILRNTDTIPIIVSDKEFRFLGNNVSKGTVDAVSITTNDGLKTKNIFVFKNNDARTRLNNGT